MSYGLLIPNRGGGMCMCEEFLNCSLCSKMAGLNLQKDFATSEKQSAFTQTSSRLPSMKGEGDISRTNYRVNLL